MAKPQNIRRFLRFSLRSLLLVTLAVAAWLGYEVHDARTVERQAEAIRALGAEVEFESGGWSLLRFMEPARYGRRIRTAQVWDARVDEALPQLAALHSLREVRVIFGGTRDQRASWLRLHDTLHRVKITPLSPPSAGTAEDGTRILWDSAERKERFARFLEKIRKCDGTDDTAVAYVEGWSGEDVPAFSWYDYQVFCAPDGSLAEVLLVTMVHLGVGAASYAVVLMVDDECVDARSFSGSIRVYLRDVDSDGYAELAVEGPDRAQPSANAVPKSLELYAIEPDGFHKLLPGDRLNEERP